MKLRLGEEQAILRRMAEIDALAGPGDFSPVHGGQVVRDHVFTPAGLLIGEQLAGIAATPASAAWWAKVIPTEPTVAPGEYL